MSSSTASALSADDISTYDRQIRVWGHAGQRRIQEARILVLGMRALFAEALKNICLAGVGAIVLHDQTLVQAEDLSGNFALNPTCFGQRRDECFRKVLQELNPKVDVQIAESESLPGLHSTDKQHDAAFASCLSQYSVVMASDCTPQQAARLARLCRANSPPTPFYWGDTHGMHGFVFSDLDQVDLSRNNSRSGQKVTETVRQAQLSTLLTQRTAAQLVKDNFQRRTFRKVRSSCLALLLGVMAFRYDVLQGNAIQCQPSAPSESKQSASVLGKRGRNSPYTDDEPTDAATVCRRFLRWEVVSEGAVPSGDTALKRKGGEGQWGVLLEGLRETCDVGALADMARMYRVDLAVSASVLGGVLGQEVLKCVSGNGCYIGGNFIALLPEPALVMVNEVTAGGEGTAQSPAAVDVDLDGGKREPPVAVDVVDLDAKGPVSGSAVDGGTDEQESEIVL